MDGWLSGDPVWPYAKILDIWGPEFEMYRKSWRLTTNRSIERYRLRDRWVERFGFAIPCAELLDELAKSDLVIEVGAGTGYMTRLMYHRGIRVAGSDYGARRRESGHGFTIGQYDALQIQAPGKTMVRRCPKAGVFCSWPTLGATWFRQMLRAMTIGQRLIVIREDACAEESAWQYLNDCFDELAVINIPAFEFMNDYASVHIKKRQRAK